MADLEEEPVDSSGKMTDLEEEPVDSRGKIADLEEEPVGEEVEPIEIDDDFQFKNLTLDQKNWLVSDMLKKLEMSLPPYNPLFELFSVCVEFEFEGDEKRGELSGFIQVHDGSESGPVFFFDREPGESSQHIVNKGFVSLTGPDPCRTVSAAGSLEMITELYVQVNDKELDVSNVVYEWDFEQRLCRLMYYNQCKSYVARGADGFVKLYYIVVKRAVQTTMEVSFRTPDGGPLDVYGNILAYYGGLDYGLIPSEREFYKATLFDRPKGKSAVLQNGKIPLVRSMLAVPSELSLVIEAHLSDSLNDTEILGGTFKFPAQLKDSSIGCIEGEVCSIDLKVDWKCEAVPYPEC